MWYGPLNPTCSTSVTPAGPRALFIAGETAACLCVLWFLECFTAAGGVCLCMERERVNRVKSIESLNEVV